MQRPTRFARTTLRKYRKLLLILFVALISLAYPLKLASQNVSVSVVMDEAMYTQQKLTVDYNYDLEVFDNIDANSTKFSSIINQHIAQAEHEIYISMYSFTITSTRNALFNAALDGVEINLIYNYDKKEKLESMLANVLSYINVIYVGENRNDESFYLMHHKYMIIDPGTENEVLITGPWNWSYHQQDLDPNILLKIKDSEIIDSFLNESKRLVNGEAGVNKFTNFNYAPWEKEITYPNGDKIEVWWSPGRSKNSLNNRLLELIDAAESNIDISVTVMDAKSIAKKLTERAQEGVKVRLVVDTNVVANLDSIIPWLRNRIEVNNIENIEIFEGGKKATEAKPERSIMHYHNMIIDNEIVVTGTANWTHGGFFRNDENTLIFHSNKTAEIFSSIFDEYLDYLFLQES